jgi:hypothetical protein
VAAEYHQAANGEVSEMKYRFYVAPAGGVEGQIRKLTGMESGDKLIVLDIPDDGAFYDAGADISAKGIKAAIAGLEAKNLTKQTLNK